MPVLAKGGLAKKPAKKTVKSPKPTKCNAGASYKG